MSLGVVWGDSLELLADRLLDSLEASASGDPLSREGLVLGSRVTETWLKQRFLHREVGHRRVLAGWDTYLLREFVGDVLSGDVFPGRREPRFHPYAPEALTWRVHSLLRDRDFLRRSGCLELHSYLGGNPSPLRALALAGAVARLLGEYQLYRPRELLAWEAAPGAGGWQGEIWRELNSQDPASSLRQFLEMKARLNDSGVERTYQRLSVFGVGTIPPAYLEFLSLLSRRLKVVLYLFNPCREEWYSDISPLRREREEGELLLEGAEAALDYLETGNPLLSSWGQVAQQCIGEVLDRTEGEAVEMFSSSYSSEVLGIVQEDIRSRRVAGTLRPIQAGDGSLLVSIAHSPQREVEVLHDQLLRAFAELPGLRPRQIQVLVSDMEVYAPYLEAVFSSASPFIPWARAERIRREPDPAAEAFISLLRLPGSRWPVSKVLSLLECAPFRETFGLGEGEVGIARELIEEAQIRWGWDGADREKACGVFFEENSWRQGLDRLLAGYALAEDAPAPLELADGSLVLPVDPLAGRGKEALRGLLACLRSLRESADELKGARPLSSWADTLRRLLAKFFRSGNESYRELVRLAQAVEALERLSGVPGVSGPVEPETVAEFLEEKLQSGGEAYVPGGEAVIFSELRLGRIVPRRVICLLGMNDGEFPRRDSRSAYDLLRLSSRRLDRSLAGEDRGAFLEAVMSARDRLLISYCGRNLYGNEILPPATVVGELRDYLREEFSLPPGSTAPDGQDMLFCERLQRLQPFSPEYFHPGSDLFSYSPRYLAAARALTEGKGRTFKPLRFSAPPLPDEVWVLDWEELLRFFRCPAEFFFLHRLGLRLPREGEDGDEDREPLVVGALEKYRAAEVLLDGKQKLDEETKSARLLASGWFPPAAAGRQGVDCLRRELAEALALPNPFGGGPSTLGEFLGGPLRERKVGWAGCRTEVSALLTLRDSGGKEHFCHLRPSGEIRGMDLLRGWLGHLLLSVSGHPSATLVAGRKKGKISVSLLAPVAPEEASSRLEEVVELFRRGLESPLPFAPESSWEFVRRENLSADPDPSRAAQKKWCGHEGKGECRSGSLRLAFGENGPLGEPDFAEVARKVYLPILNAGAGL